MHLQIFAKIRVISGNSPDIIGYDGGDTAADDDIC
jgi:hypothetical protein